MTTKKHESARPLVLLVDDKEANLVALEAQLADMDCELVRAKSGNEALRALLKREYALVLLDVQMPDIDGYEVAALSRENPATRDVPIIFVTAMTETAENEVRGYGKGAVDVLFKPINPNILRSKVRIFLDLHIGKQRLAAEVRAHEETLEQLRLSNAALRHFTHAASHDLSAPLRAMKGFLEVLEERIGPTLDAESRAAMERVRNAHRRMRDLLDALLVYAGLQRPIAPTEIDLNQLVAQVRTDLGDRIRDANATVTLGPMPTVRGDRARLYQLFLNLIANAVKFRRPGHAPTIHVGVTDDVERTYAVKDDGIGIDRADAGTVFEPFHRLHGVATYEGTGLGLAICKQIVEQHYGTIWIESELGEGTTFFFTLGAVDEPIRARG